MRVQDGATVVLFIPKDVALGAYGSGQRNIGIGSGGGAGIEVPSTSTLVVTGEGTVDARGGEGTSGGRGGNGGNGEAWAYWSPSYDPKEAIVGGTGGAGGAGGSGGYGGGAGIGGAGNQTMGTVYILGSVQVHAYSGNGGTSFGATGTKGKSASATLPSRTVPNYVPVYTQSYGGGGGGGGGGAPGSAPDCAIGGGGGNGRSGERGTSGYGGPVGLYHDPYDGQNGATGSWGTNGGAGTLYVSPTASVNVNRAMNSATTHPALQHTIAFDANGGTFSTSVHAVTATLGEVLPDCIPAPSWPGCVFLGWATEPVCGNLWYDADGSKKVSSYADPTITVLYAQWKLPSLQVASLWGDVFPVRGLSELEPGTKVSAWVTLPPERDGVRLEFKGWTGTGSVPASGTGTDVSFTLEEDSTLTWNWECRNRITVSVPVDGQCDFGTQWIEHGTNALATIIPPEGPYEVELRGDTNGVSFAGTTLAIPSDGPRNIEVRMVAWNLRVGLVPWSAPGSPDGWTAVEDQSADDGYSLRSAQVEPDATSTVSATISGAGTLSFDWRVSANRGDYCRLYVDGVLKAQITRTPEWTAGSVAIDGNGDHVVSWVYDRKSKTEANDNAAYLDNVSWAPPQSATSTTPVPVPYAWFDNDHPSILAAHGGDYEGAANAMAANGVNTVWECYVADISPTNETARFVVRIEVDNGVPRVTPDPDRGNARVYRVLGARTLGPSTAWDDVTEIEDLNAAGYRFFKVTVGMPENGH